jgi:hypothetical protein
MHALLRSIGLAALLAAAGPAAQAACDTGLAERMHAKLHPRRALDHERAVCEPWRGVPGRFIVVLPLPRATAESGSTRFDLDVMVVEQADNGNTERTRVVSRLFEEDALSEDAVRITSIRLDSARYALAPEARAFGLRIQRQGASRANPYASESLSLYLPQGARLAKVLDGLEMTLEQGEWDTHCSGSFETVRGALSVERAAAGGHAELVLRQSRSIERSSPMGDECVSQSERQSLKPRVLRYDGTRYRPVGSAAPN